MTVKYLLQYSFMVCWWCVIAVISFYVTTVQSGLTPLHVASFMGHMNIAMFLLQSGASPNYQTVRGETPLHLATRANQTDIIRVLLRHGAHVDATARVFFLFLTFIYWNVEKKRYWHVHIKCYDGLLLEFIYLFCFHFRLFDGLCKIEQRVSTVMVIISSSM